jgi:protein SHQ1
MQVMDILYAYYYDLKTTYGEHTSESAWTIIKVSSVLSSFITFEEFKDNTEMEVKCVIV